MKESDSKERFLLQFSTWMGVVFTCMGIAWGLSINSSVILFDGIYSGVSTVLSVLSILALRIMSSGNNDPESLENHNFHLGRMSFEPMVVALKSIVIIGVCVYGVVSAAVHILRGGGDPESVNSVSGMIYSLVSILTCLFSWLFLKTKGRDMPDLVKAESEQWLIDSVFCCLVLLGFIGSYLLSLTAYRRFVPYIDPGMVIVASFYFIRVPALRFLACMRELLLMAPEGDIQQELVERVNRIAKAHRFEGAVVRSAKIGRELAVDIAILAPPEMQTVEIDQLDAIRAEIERELLPLGYKLWMNVVFTRQKHWA